MALLTVVSGCIPEARFHFAPSIQIPASLWICLLHPGSTNTSGVGGTVTKAINLMLDQIYLEEYNAEAQLAQRDGREPVYPSKRQLLVGGGSVGATGMQMSKAENRDAAIAAECEIEQILCWFSAVGRRCMASTRHG